jgi:asparagine synthase (glutamine-hydrolysing)
MCGIAGLMNRDGRPPPVESLAKLQAALAHRGPDGVGTRIVADCGLVHTRLAIVDVTGGAQPLVAADGVALIANGEIYNDPALRAAMPDTAFATRSDCESALHLYPRGVAAEDAIAFVERLRGMYALALHDPAAGRLVLARDPFGIKPLYVAETAAGFAFASEPQALIAAGLIAPQLDPARRDELLALQFTTGADTVFAGIARLLPGEAVAVEGGRIVARRRRAALAPGERAADEPSAVAALTAAWRDSVAAHERSDVPFGVFLSGGIDSAAVLTMMARIDAKPPLAFTAAFPGTGVADERGTARAVAAALGAVHVEVEIAASDFWKSLPAIAAAMDDPAADYAVVPTYLLARQAARDVKVVLTGEGGDEILAGYGRYRSALRPWPFARRPWRQHRLARLGVLRAIPAGWRAGLDRLESEVAAAGFRGLQAVQAADAAAWLPNDLLTKLDRCLMAHGVEGRVPFLDPVMAAAAFALPRGLKIRGGRGKWLLRRWLAAECPAAAAMAPKRGFTVPVGDWIAGEGRRLAALVAAQPGIVEVCRPEAVAALFRAADPAHGNAMWLLLFYALWHQRHILGRRAGGDVFAALDRHG